MHRHQMKDGLQKGAVERKHKKKFFKVKRLFKMKKMMIWVSAIMMALTACAENMNLNPFEGVNVNVPARVRFVYGEKYGVDIQTADSLTASAIRWTVKDGVLRIRSIDDGDLGDVCITIMSPVEPKLSVGRNMEIKETNRVQRDLARSHERE